MDKIPNWYRTVATRIAVATLTCTFAAPSLALECGDVDSSGTVSVNDALRVLRRAVQLPVELECPQGECTPTTSSTIPSPPTTVEPDECVTNFDCEAAGDPEKTQCCEFKCAECNSAADCDPGETCGSGCTCSALP